jgi:sulfane dehydrogenase subunit SoxC
MSMDNPLSLRRVQNVVLLEAYGDLAPGTGSARTPIEKLEGIITPSGLHFDRSHNGTPDR